MSNKLCASVDDRYAAVIENSPIYSIPELFKHAARGQQLRRIG
ncbi:hypothetical protein [Desulfosporosinus lacus]|nr:hypothetical protein [Desulfosporosinus lacus]